MPTDPKATWQCSDAPSPSRSEEGGVRTAAMGEMGFVRGVSHSRTLRTDEPCVGSPPKSSPPGTAIRGAPDGPFGRLDMLPRR
mgnify:CR=1 FL=1